MWTMCVYTIRFPLTATALIKSKVSGTSDHKVPIFNEWMLTHKHDINPPLYTHTHTQTYALSTQSILWHNWTKGQYPTGTGPVIPAIQTTEALNAELANPKLQDWTLDRSTYCRSSDQKTSTSQMADFDINREATYSSLEFLYEVPSKLLCSLCNNAAKEPWQHGKCERLFCRSCITQNKDYLEFCPYCKEENADFYTDIKSKLKFCITCTTGATNIHRTSHSITKVTVSVLHLLT